MLYMNFLTQNQEISTVRGFYHFSDFFLRQYSEKVNLTWNFQAIPSVSL